MSTSENAQASGNPAFESRPWKRNMFILQTLVTKDFKLKYRRSVLGVLWSVLNPLLMMIVMSAVFSYMFRFNIENFPLYLILGQILFTLMTDTAGAAMTSIIDASGLIKKIRVEKMVFPVQKACFALVNFCFSAIAAVLVMLFFRVVPTLNALLLPWLLICVFAFSVGLGLVLASLAVFFRDTLHLWGVIVTAWSYATPLFYPVELLPEILQKAMLFNPMYQYIEYFRDIMMYGITPSLEQNLACFAMAAITLAVGVFVFRKTEHKFILYV